MFRCVLGVGMNKEHPIAIYFWGKLIDRLEKALYEYKWKQGVNNECMPFMHILQSKTLIIWFNIANNNRKNQERGDC